ncbi:MAG: hypothetical protein ACTSP1_13900, partial [Candidatus Freyarchaeota archaeon]
LGAKLFGLNTTVVGVRVTAKEWANPGVVTQYEKEAYDLIKDHIEGVPEPDFEDITMLDDYAGPEYGAPTEEGVEAIELMKRYENIQLETTYTGKALAGLIDYTRKHDLENTPILFWNTYNSVDLSQYMKPGINDLENTPILFWNTYNSVDLSQYMKPGITYKDLPGVFHKYFKEDLLNKK